MRSSQSRQDRARILWSLPFLIAAAIFLAGTLPGGVAAHTLFQSPVFDSDLPTATALPSSTLAPSATPLPARPGLSPTPFRSPAAPTAPAATAIQATPTRQPSPTPLPAALTATAVAASFLAPPTLTLPGAEQPAAEGARVPLPLSAPPVTPVARPVDPPPAVSGDLAAMIDRGLAAVSYLWLSCGILVLAGVLAGSIWIMRRRP